MKRLLMILFSLVLLCACLPTPETEFVVNKGDGAVEQKLDETQTDAAEPGAQIFPDRWEQEETEIAKGIRMTVNAEIVQKADGRYPVYRTRYADVTKDEVVEKLNTLLPKPVEYYQWKETKAYWTEMLQKYLDYVEERRAWLTDGIPNLGDADYHIPDDREVESETAKLMERIQNAPDAIETKPASDYSGLEEKSSCFYTLESGETVSAGFRRQSWSMGRKNTGGMSRHILWEYQLESLRFDGDDWLADAWVQPTMTREEAETILNREIERLGYTDFTVHAAYPADLLRLYEGETYTDNWIAEPVSTGWAFRLRRNYGDYPTVNNYQSPAELTYGEEDAFIEPLYDERIDVYIDADGIEDLWYGVKKEVAGLVNPNVELMPFDALKTRILNAFAACLPGSSMLQSGTRFEIYRMVLTTYTVREKDSDDMLEMPCWFIFFDFPIDNKAYREFKRNDLTGELQECLILNAVDGSIIDRAAGY